MAQYPTISSAYSLSQLCSQFIRDIQELMLAHVRIIRLVEIPEQSSQSPFLTL